MAQPVNDWREAAAAEYAERRAALFRQRDKAAKTLANLERKLRETEEQIAELDRGARVFGLDLPVGSLDIGMFSPEELNRARPAGLTVNMPPGAGKSRQFKDLALEVLESEYPRPLKAIEVQERVQAELGRTFHWKTAGMTLYRLKNEHAVRRSGQDWYFVPPEERGSLAQIAERAQELVKASLPPEPAEEAV